MGKKKLLITGVSGLLGSNLAYCLRDKYDVIGWYHTHPVCIDNARTYKVDLVSSEINEFIQQDVPDVVIHCAALTNVDACQKDKALADKVNILATEKLSEACSSGNIKMVYVSTDSVYSGSKERNAETDMPDPQNYYGFTKLKGEEEALKNKDNLVLRTNIFGWNVQHKQSLGEWVLSQIEKGEGFSGFKDAFFSTIYTFTFADILHDILKNDLKGVYNFGSRDSLSKYDFAKVIAEKMGMDIDIKKISVDDFVFSAKRGKRLSMDVSKLEKDLDGVLPLMEVSINRFLDDKRTEKNRDISKMGKNCM